MKFKLLTIAALATTLFFSSCAKEETPEKTTDPAIATQSMDFSYTTTVGDLVKKFGDNIHVEGGTLADLPADMEIYMTEDISQVPADEMAKSQCGPDVPPCASINGIVNSQYMPIANECCCVFAAGTICCGQSGNLLAVLVLVTPNNPNCGI